MNSLAALPPNRSQRTSKWPRLRSLLGKAFARPAANSASTRLIHDYFRHKAQEQGYTLSHSQQRVIDCMAQLANALLRGHDQQVRSLYLHGAVGRGKSWLLDGFFRAIPLEQKQRLHFHDFFAQLHQGMFRHRQQPDALETTLDELLEHCQVLCFDEFHVHDIGDAMLITRLFKALLNLIRARSELLTRTNLFQNFRTVKRPHTAASSLSSKTRTCGNFTHSVSK